MKSYKILSVKVDSLNFDEILAFISDTVSSRKKRQIATVNNEFIVEAQKNIEFCRALNSFSLCLPDSAGIVWAVKKLYKDKIDKTPGADLFDKICRLSCEKGFRIFLLGGSKGVASRAKEKMQKKYPSLRVVGTIDGIKVEPQESNKDIVDSINQTNADIVFVALGAPKQELWIARNMDKANACILMGIGGTLDFVSGKIKRAPAWIRKINLEWLFRLVIEPKRFGRILTALIVFPYLVLFKNSADDS